VEDEDPTSAGRISTRRIAFLYAGSADATIKPLFLKALRRGAVTQYPYHRAVSFESQAWTAEAFQACREDGYERMAIVGDTHADGYPGSLVAPLEALRSAHKRGLLKEFKTVEFFLDVDNEADVHNLAEAVTPFLASFVTAPHIKLYALLNLASTAKQKRGLSALLTALTIAAPSRMAEIGKGLDGIRRAPESAFLLARYEELPVPEIQEAAKLVVDNALMNGTFSSLPDQGGVPLPSINRVERLLSEHKVGIEEPPLPTSFAFEFKWAIYRDALLHPLMSTLVRHFPDEAAFLQSMGRLAKDFGTRDPVFKLLLSDLQNEIVAARTRLTTGLRFADLSRFEPQFDQAVDEIVKPFIHHFRFAIWPLLDQRVKPLDKDPCVEGLYEEYERCITATADAMCEILRIQICTRQEEIKKIMADTADRLPGRWLKPPTSLLFVHQDLERDHRDELWPEKLRCGFLGLLKRELCL